MRILHVIHRYWPALGGSESFAANILKYLVDNSYQVKVITTDALDFELFWSPRAKRVSQDDNLVNGIQVLRFSIDHIPLSQFTYPALRRLAWALSRTTSIPSAWLHRLARLTPRTPELFRWLATTQERFDLVAGMAITFEGLIEAARQFARRQQCPFVVYPLTHLGAGPQPGVDAASRLYTMRHQIETVLNSDYLMAINTDEAAFYQQRGMPSERIAVVEPGVDLAELKGGNGERFRRRYGLQGPIVGVLSTMAFDKGVPHVVEAVRHLWQQGICVHLVLAGAVLEQFKRYLAKLPAADRSRLIVLGTVDHQTKLDLLDAIDLLALPSRTDAFGIVYLESWAYGKPVIAAQTWGVRTVVKHGQDGLLVPFGDVRSLCEAIRLLIENHTLRRQLGEAGRHKVTNYYTWDRSYARIREIYTQLTQR
jgi:glycosyltransferase involved in cell wall biosynthesis